MKEYVNHPIVTKYHDLLKETYVYPVRVLNTFGYLVESTTGPERTPVIELLSTMDTSSAQTLVRKDMIGEEELPKYHVYGMRHPDNDWSVPVSVGEVIVANRFGWYITDTEINFNDPIVIKNGLDLNIASKNREIALRYGVNGNNTIAYFFNFYKDLSRVTKTDEFIGVTPIDLITVINNEEKIISMIHECEHGDVE